MDNLMEVLKANKNIAAIERLYKFGKITDKQYAELTAKEEAKKVPKRRRKRTPTPVVAEEET